MTSKGDYYAIIVIAVLVGFIIGYVTGASVVLNKCVNVAKEFMVMNNMSIDKSLIIDYLHRAGL